MDGAILALNAGSSSLKFAAYGAVGPSLLFRGSISGIGTKPVFAAHDATGEKIEGRDWPADHLSHADVIADLLAWIESRLGGQKLIAVGHRVVHGGRQFYEPTRLTPPVVAALDALTPLAPLHQPNSLGPIRIIAEQRPDLPQIGCFDTAFHHGLAPPVSRFAVPRALEDEGVRRYGFHGLSYTFIAGAILGRFPELAAGRTVVAHLGNGASLCAMQDGKSRDTTMGFTALDGLVMGTRCGAIDPGVLLYMLQQKGMSPENLEAFLYHQCGLVGVSGVSSDMRDLLESDDPRAKEAVDLFAFQVARQTAMMASTLGGLDAFVFTGGIGENSAQIRAMVCERLGWLGAAIDPEANTEGDGAQRIGKGRMAVLVIPTDEEIVVARQALGVLGG